VKRRKHRWKARYVAVRGGSPGVICLDCKAMVAWVADGPNGGIYEYYSADGGKTWERISKRPECAGGAR